jgi:hypothetical protein
MSFDELTDVTITDQQGDEYALGEQRSATVYSADAGDDYPVVEIADHALPAGVDPSEIEKITGTWRSTQTATADVEFLTTRGRSTASGTQDLYNYRITNSGGWDAVDEDSEE